jgi:hypothetical protein
MAENPYQTPRSDIGVHATRVDLHRAAAAFCAWLVGSSVLSGAVLALQTAYALRNFSAETRTGRLVAVAAVRAVAPQVAASAASVALVVGSHRQPPPSTASQRTVAPWWIYAAVPPAMPIAACTMIGAGLGAMVLSYGVNVETWWGSVIALTVPGDLGFGMVCATTYSILLSATAFVATPRLAAVRWGLAAKIITTLLVTGLVTGLASAVLIAALVPQDSAGGAP